MRELLAQSLPVSALLGGTAFVLATLGGVLLGCLAAVRHRTTADALSTLLALTLISVPTFVTGPLLVLLFALYLGWLPVGGWHSLSSLILPAITLAGPACATIARITRASLLETLQAPISHARARASPQSRLFVTR